MKNLVDEGFNKVANQMYATVMDIEQKSKIKPGFPKKITQNQEQASQIPQTPQKRKLETPPIDITHQNKKVKRK